MTVAQTEISGSHPADKRVPKAIWVTGAVLSVGVALLSARYLLNIGPVPQIVADNLFIGWLLAHVAAAATALLVGPFQFMQSVRARMPRVHRWAGRVYAVGCLVGGATGFALALGASTGPISTFGFGTLSVLWIVTTAMAWRTALQRKFAAHRTWVIRSFALTLAAVTLRFYLPVLSVLPVPFEAGYQAISFLCWVPNLLLAEVYLRGPKFRLRPQFA